MRTKRESVVGQRTDLSRWRLVVDEGRQVWEYISKERAAQWPQSDAEKYHLGLDTSLPKQTEAVPAEQSARNGFEFYKALQLPDGHWGCEYGGPLFLLPGLIIAMYITETPIPQEWAIEISRYLINVANPDGGWGLHTAGESTAFGTCMNYVVLRILGMDPDDELAVKARTCMQELGTALAVPSWAKFWLCALNCYEWEGMNPVPPELWLLPEWVPFHPWRWWIHTRAVYIPMAYVYDRRLQCKVTDLVSSLRSELYLQPYDSIDWPKQRNNIADVDVYHPHSKVLDVLNWCLVQFHCYLRPTWLSRKAVRRVYELIAHEDRNTDYLCVGPVNNALHLLATYYEERAESYAFKRHQERLADFMWISSKGMMMNGTNGVQLWDTAFSVQAMVEAGLATDEKNRKCLLKALEYLDVCQIKEECEYGGPYRQSRKGAWPFSTRHQGYTVSDCTAEGLKATLLIQSQPGFPTLIGKERLEDCVDVLLSMQNADGSYASYEKVRGSELLEYLNTAEVFGRIMVEYPYPECTTSVVTALTLYSKHEPHYRSSEIREAISRAVLWIKKAQKKDGSWFGSWAICFTYGALFATESLAEVGESYHNSSVQRRACEFLLSKQRQDGGWGESYRSCELDQYIQQESQVVNTAWACIALMNAHYPDKTPIERGIKKAQGDWPQEAIEGVFNKNCMISYPNYKFYFPIKALGMFARRFEGKN